MDMDVPFKIGNVLVFSNIKRINHTFHRINQKTKLSFKKTLKFGVM